MCVHVYACVCEREKERERGVCVSLRACMRVHHCMHVCVCLRVSQCVTFILAESFDFNAVTEVTSKQGKQKIEKATYLLLFCCPGT